MTNVFVAATNFEERNVYKILLSTLEMKVIGEAADWETTLAKIKTLSTDMLIIDWELLPLASQTALKELRSFCPQALVVVLISHLDARHQAALSAGADYFISKEESPERIVERLRIVTANKIAKTP